MKEFGVFIYCAITIGSAIGSVVVIYKIVKEQFGHLLLDQDSVNQMHQ